MEVSWEFPLLESAFLKHLVRHVTVGKIVLIISRDLNQDLIRLANSRITSCNRKFSRHDQYHVLRIINKTHVLSPEIDEILSVLFFLDGLLHFYIYLYLYCALKIQFALLIFI